MLVGGVAVLAITFVVVGIVSVVVGGIVAVVVGGGIIAVVGVGGIIAVVIVAVAVAVVGGHYSPPHCLAGVRRTTSGLPANYHRKII